MSVNNIKLVHGSAIPTPDGNAENWDFQHIDFSQIDANSFDVDIKSLSESDIKKIMNGKQEMIAIPKILDVDSVNNNYVSAADSDAVNQMPCCIKSNTGSIMSQIIIPSEESGLVDNGLYVGEDLSQSITLINGKPRINWEASGIEGGGSIELKTMGKRNAEKESCGYVSMDHCYDKKHDYPVFATREYKLNSDAVKGSGIFMYHFSASNSSSDGGTNTAPQVFVDLNCRTSDKIQLSINAKSD